MPVRHQIEFDLREESGKNLCALNALSRLDSTDTFHLEQGYRPPLGIYNMSVSRILSRTKNLCAKMEEVFKSTDAASGVGLTNEVADNIELALYAAAEHFDDIKAIADGFFKQGRKQAKNTENYRKLENKIDTYKRTIYSYVNSIKHKQSRLRYYSSTVIVNQKTLKFFGYFIEGVNDGVVGPNKLFHGNGQVFSLTSIPWEIIIFLEKSSIALADFLENFSLAGSDIYPVNRDLLKETVAAATRLPLYSFDEAHPFDENIIKIIFDENFSRENYLSPYGSLDNPWGKIKPFLMVSGASEMIGDGVTRSFKIVRPSRLKLMAWS